MGYRVLLAEDTAAIRDLMRFHLIVDGRFEVVAETARGDEVLDLVRREQPDVLISDMSLPGADGLELIEAVRTGCPGCRILVFSGFAAATPQRVLDAGADAAMEKTVHDFDDVVEAAASLCEG